MAAAIGASCLPSPAAGPAPAAAAVPHLEQVLARRATVGPAPSVPAGGLELPAAPVGPATQQPPENADETVVDSPPEPTVHGPGLPAPEASVGAAGRDDPTTSPLAGVSFYGPNAGAAAAAEQAGVSPEDAALLSELAGVPTATWLGAWSGDVAASVRSVMDRAGAVGGVPIFVTYNVPDRDCGSYSAGGSGSPAEYARWIDQVAAGIGTGSAVVIVEPDALAQQCGNPEERYQLLRRAVEVLERNPGTRTYLDAGHSEWISASTMAGRLRAAGVDGADGFALNVSNFGTTADNVSYGQTMSTALGGAHFVIDTSRNGSGPGSDWCNPTGRTVGERPTSQTGWPQVDALLWVKTPGESDGTCNGGPAAGTFWPQYALGLMRTG